MGRQVSADVDDLDIGTWHNLDVQQLVGQGIYIYGWKVGIDINKSEN